MAIDVTCIQTFSSSVNMESDIIPILAWHVLCCMVYQVPACTI